MPLASRAAERPDVRSHAGAWERENTLFDRGPDHPARRRGASAVKRAAGRDVQRLQVVATERTVGHFITRHREKGERFPFRAENVDAAFLVGGRLYVAAGLNKPNPPFEPDRERKGGIYVLSGEGSLLAFLQVPRDEVTNCAFGGDDLKTLYITSGGTLYSIRTTTPGQVVGPRQIKDR